MPGIIEIVDRKVAVAAPSTRDPRRWRDFRVQMQFFDEQVHDALVAKFDRRTVVEVRAQRRATGPGFLLMSDQAADDAAQAAYDERSKRMQSAWRRGNKSNEPDENPGSRSVTHSQSGA